MDFGGNLLSWIQSQAQSLVLVGIIIIGVWLLFKKETSKLISFLIIGVAGILLVFNVTGVKDLLLQLGNSILGA